MEFTFGKHAVTVVLNHDCGNMLVTMKLTISRLTQLSRLRQFIKFCLVGSSGVIVDMTVLYFLTDSQWCGWNVTLSKVCSAEAAMLNNFLWNEVWTFRGFTQNCGIKKGVVRRLLMFHVICGFGIALAVFFLHLFYTWLKFNLYEANLFAILLATFWNFWINAVFNWRIKSTSKC